VSVHAERLSDSQLGLLFSLPRLTSLDVQTSELSVRGVTALLPARAATLTRLSMTLTGGQKVDFRELTAAIAKHLTCLRDLSLVGAASGSFDALPLRTLPLQRLRASSLITPDILAAFAEAGMPLTDLTVGVFASSKEARVLSGFTQLRRLSLWRAASHTWVDAAPPSLTELGMIWAPPGIGPPTTLSHLTALRCVRVRLSRPRDLAWLTDCGAPPTLESVALGGTESLDDDSVWLLAGMRLRSLALQLPALRPVAAELSALTTLTHLQINLVSHNFSDYREVGFRLRDG
jgi:hypothetical protein